METNYGYLSYEELEEMGYNPILHDNEDTYTILLKGSQIPNYIKDNNIDEVFPTNTPIQPDQLYYGQVIETINIIVINLEPIQ